MNIETWLAFVAASAVLLIIPGPTILLVISYALGRGMRTALPVAVGVALGDFTAMTLSLLGLGALLATSALLFTIFKWAGAAYLVWLGIALWRAGARLEVEARKDEAPAFAHVGPRLACHGPEPEKHDVLYCLPAAVHRSELSAFGTRCSIFEATFLGLAFANAIGYGLIASRARGLVHNERAIGIFNRSRRQPVDRCRPGRSERAQRRNDDSADNLPGGW